MRTRHKQSGFTLVELMIVVVIFGIIAAAIVVACVIYFGHKTQDVVEASRGPAVQQGATSAAEDYARRMEDEPNPIALCEDSASVVDQKVDCIVRLPSKDRSVSLRCPFQGTGTCLPVTHP